MGRHIFAFLTNAVFKKKYSGRWKVDVEIPIEIYVLRSPGERSWVCKKVNVFLVIIVVVWTQDYNAQDNWPMLLL